MTDLEPSINWYFIYQSYVWIMSELIFFRMDWQLFYWNFLLYHFFFLLFEKYVFLNTFENDWLRINERLVMERDGINKNRTNLFVTLILTFIILRPSKIFKIYPKLIYTFFE